MESKCKECGCAAQPNALAGPHTHPEEKNQQHTGREHRRPAASRCQKGQHKRRHRTSPRRVSDEYA